MSLYKFIKDGGLSVRDIFENWVDKQLQGKTFSELNKCLHVVMTDVKSGKPVIFN
jgi:NTE family protein